MTLNVVESERKIGSNIDTSSNKAAPVRPILQKMIMIPARIDNYQLENPNELLMPAK